MDDLGVPLFSETSILGTTIGFCPGPSCKLGRTYVFEHVQVQEQDNNCCLPGMFSWFSVEFQSAGFFGNVPSKTFEGEIKAAPMNIQESLAVNRQLYFYESLTKKGWSPKKEQVSHTQEIEWGKKPMYRVKESELPRNLRFIQNILYDYLTTNSGLVYLQSDTNHIQKKQMNEDWKFIKF